MREFSLFELFFGALPEMCLFVVGAYILCKTKLNIKKAVLIIIIAGTATYLISMFLAPGMNVILAFPTLVLLLIVIARINAVKAAISVLVMAVIRMATEWLYIMFVDVVLRLSIDKIMQDPIKKTIGAFPSTIIFGLIIFTIYWSGKLKFKEKTFLSSKN